MFSMTSMPCMKKSYNITHFLTRFFYSWIAFICVFLSQVICYEEVFHWDPSVPFHQEYNSNKDIVLFYNEEGLISFSTSKCGTSDIQYVSTGSSSQGLILIHKITSPSSNYSIIGADFELYISASGSPVISFMETGSEITSFNPPPFESDLNIKCTSTTSFFTYSIQLSSTATITDPNTMKFSKSITDTNPYEMGIKSYTMWVNCVINCDVCSKSTVCSTCLAGFKLRSISFDEVICEQFQNCSQSNCQSCWKGKTGEICASCFSPYTLDASGACVSSVSSSCASNQYYDLTSSSCLEYTKRALFQDPLSTSFLEYTGTKDIAQYKCPHTQSAIFYKWSSYSSFYCGCLKANCLDCSTSTSLCDTCLTGYQLSGSTCIPNCASNQFFETASSSCKNCSLHCESCPSLTDCYSCQVGYKFNLITRLCQLICSDGYYWDVGQSKCILCPLQNCLTCSSATICTKCNTSYDLNFGQCACMTGQYQPSPNQACLPCTANCLACTSGTDCSKCAVAFEFKTDTNLCGLICPSKQYWDETYLSCQPCDPSCLNCFNTSTKCTSCPPTYSLNYSQCKCHTNQYYTLSTDTCTDCMTDCLTCTGSNNCTQCIPGYSFISPSCQPVCQTGKYWDIPSSSCVNCTLPNCLACKSATVCTSCDGTHTLYNNQCQCLTTQFYDTSSSTCVNCLKYCQKCTSLSDCQTCNPLHSYNSAHNQCEKTCTSHQYWDNTLDSCIECSILNCSTCSSSSVCTECSTEYTLLNDICQCKKTEYFISPSQTCEPCMNNCQQCTSSSDCTTCSVGYNFDTTLKICKLICGDGLYWDDSLKQCESCQIASCSTCSSLTVCTKCDSDHLLINNECQCLKNQFYDSLMSTCVTCMTHCLSCTSSSDCSSCNPGYQFNSSTQICESLCLIGQYWNISSGSCTNCAVSQCGSCDPDGIICSVCKPTFTLASNTCSCLSNQFYKSSDNTCNDCMKECKTCTSINDCSECSSVSTWVPADSRCQMICISGQYLDSAANSCLQCTDAIPSCQACSSSTVCTQCDSSYKLYHDACQCLSNQYYDDYQLKCVNCITNCLSCNSSLDCTSCKPGYSFNNITKTCDSLCQPNQFWNGTSCDSCNSSCLTCASTSTTCTSCDINHKLNNSNCKCLSNQYYTLPSNSCTNCMTNCLNCTASNNCSKCSEGYTYNTTSHTCKLTCPDGQYWKTSSQSCASCSVLDNCDTCSDVSTCTKCKIQYQLLNNACKCLTTQYFNSQNSTCVDCQANCLSCTSSVDCSFCSAGYQFNNVSKKCEEICSSGQFWDTYNNQCSNCSVNCKKCTSSSECTDCKDGYGLVNKACPCLSTQYYDTQNVTCVDCQANCLSCSASSCSQCDGQHFQDENDQTKCIACEVSHCKTCSGKATSCGTCNDGYQVNSKNECQIAPFVGSSLSQTSLNNEGYTFVIQFSEQISSNYSNLSSLVDLTIAGKTDFTYLVTSLKNNQMTIEVKSQVSIKSSQVSIAFSKSFVEDNHLKVTTITQDLPSFVFVSPATREASQQIQTIGDAASTAVISSILPIVILSNFYILVNTIDITGFLYYLMFINIRHPENVVAFYSVFKNFQFPFIPNIFQDMVDPNFTQEAPPKFTEMSTDLYFIKNVGQTITIWIIITGVYFVAKIISFVPIPYVQGYLKLALPRTWEFSSFFDMLWNTYIYALMGVFLQFMCYNSEDSTYILNYILHSICTLAMLSAPFLVTWLIYREQDIKRSAFFNKRLSTLIGGVQLYDIDGKPNSTLGKQEKSLANIDAESQTKQNPQEKTKPNQPQISAPISIIESPINQIDKKISFTSNNILKQGPTLSELPLVSSLKTSSFASKRAEYQRKLTKYYTPILYFRKVIFSIIICYLTGNVFLQLSFIIVLNAAMFAYLAIIHPLESKHENIKNCAGEIALIGICSSAMFLVNDNDENAESKRIKIGWVIVCLSGLILLWHTLQLLKEVVVSIFKLVKSVINIIRNQFASPKAKEAARQSKYLDSVEKLESNQKFTKNDQNLEVSFNQKQKIYSSARDTEGQMISERKNSPVINQLTAKDQEDYSPKPSNNFNRNQETSIIQEQLDLNSSERGAGNTMKQLKSAENNTNNNNNNNNNWGNNNNNNKNQISRQQTFSQTSILSDGKEEHTLFHRRDRQELLQKGFASRSVFSHSQIEFAVGTVLKLDGLKNRNPSIISNLTNQNLNNDNNQHLEEIVQLNDTIDLE